MFYNNLLINFNLNQMYVLFLLSDFNRMNTYIWMNTYTSFFIKYTVLIKWWIDDLFVNETNLQLRVFCAGLNLRMGVTCSCVRARNMTKAPALKIPTSIEEVGEDLQTDVSQFTEVATTLLVTITKFPATNSNNYCVICIKWESGLSTLGALKSPYRSLIN